MTQNPWLSGCYELLEHGIEHFLNDTEFDRRLAMISIDNALELAVKTYISRNLRVLNIKRKDYNNIKRDFSKLLSLILKVAPSKITEQELSSIEHNHELRNNLYHEGIGISVNKEIVKSYSEEAISLISKLYEVDLSYLVKKVGIFNFIKKFNVLENEWHRIELSMLIFILDGLLSSGLTIKERLSELASKGIISDVQYENLITIFNFIQIIKSKSDKITFQDLEKIEDLIKILREIDAFFKSIVDNKKIEKRKEKLNRIKKYSEDQFNGDY